MNNKAKKLFQAADTGNVEDLKDILTNATVQDINSRTTNPMKFTPLIIAAKRGYAEIVDALLTDGRADVNIKNKIGSTALTWASWNIYDNVVAALLECRSIDVNGKDGDKWSALIHACAKGRTNSVRLLLKHPDIQVNALGGGDSDDTALMFACSSDRKFTKTVEELLQHPDIDVNAQNPNTGYTALMYATFKDYSRTVTALLQHRDIDVNMRCKKNNMTALMIASENACTKSLAALLQHPNIDVYLKSKDGETAFDMATNEETRTYLREHMEANPAPAPPVPEQAPVDHNSGDVSPNAPGALTPEDESEHEEEADQEAERDLGEDGNEEETVRMAPRGASHALSGWSRAHRFEDSQSQDPLRDGFVRSHGIATAASATIDGAASSAAGNNYAATIAAPVVPAHHPHLNGWLSKRLLDDAENPFPVELIQLCELKLVYDEGFACEQDFAQLPEEDFTGEYLTQIGIVRKGLHIRLRRLHKELKQEYERDGAKRAHQLS